MALTAGDGTTGHVRYEMPVAGGVTWIEMGDVLAPAAGGERNETLLTDHYALIGVSAARSTERGDLMVFAGRGRYGFASGAPEDPSTLAGFRTLRRGEQLTYGGGYTAVHEPLYIDNRSASAWDGIASAEVSYAASPGIRMFSQALLSNRSAVGCRAGVQGTGHRSSAGFAFYQFDERFPYLYPLYRPGETGAQISGSFRPTEWSSISAVFDYFSPHGREQARNWRGALHAFQMFGTHRPALYLSISTNDVMRDSLGDADRFIVADRFVLGARRSSVGDFFDVRAAWVANSALAPDRGELQGSWRKVLSSRSRMEGSLLAQHEDGQNGVIAELRVDRSLRGPWSYAFGGGVVLVDRRGQESGDGVVRLGLTRTSLSSGWWGRIEARIPVSIGLPRSNLRTNMLALEAGRRMRWAELDDMVDAIFPILTRGSMGSVEGTVTLEGAGLEGLGILADGSPVAVTDREGHYRFGRVRAGPVSIAIDTVELPPGLSAEGGLARAVIVEPGQTVRADFALNRSVTMQGVIVVCDEGSAVRPLRGVRVALIGPAGARTYETDILGSFRDDSISPAVYDLVVDPASLPPGTSIAGAPIRIDLTRDVLNHVMRFGCPESAEEQRPERIAPPLTEAVTRTIAGSVFECVNGERQSLAGVEVAILGPRFSSTVITDASGAFLFAEVPPGQYLVLVDRAEVSPANAGAVPRLMVDVTAGDRRGVSIGIACPRVSEP
jgi:hypothetical protein